MEVDNTEHCLFDTLNSLISSNPQVNSGSFRKQRLQLDPPQRSIAFLRYLRNREKNVTNSYATNS